MFGHFRLDPWQSILFPVIPALKVTFLKWIQSLKSLSKCLRNFRSVNSSWTSHCSRRYQGDGKDCGFTCPVCTQVSARTFWIQWKRGDVRTAMRGLLTTQTLFPRHVTQGTGNSQAHILRANQIDHLFNLVSGLREIWLHLIQYW